MVWTTRQSRMLGTSDGAPATAAIIAAPRRVRTSQPQQATGIDPRVVGIYTPHDTSRLAVLGAPSRVVNYAGSGFFSDLTSKGYESAVSGTTANKTLIFVGRVGSSSSFGIASLHLAGTYSSMIYVNSTGTLSFFYANGSVFTPSGWAVVNNQLVVVVASYNGTTVKFSYRDLRTNQTYTASSTASGASAVSTFRAGPFFNDRPLITNLSVVLGVALSDAEIASLIANPYQIFAPDTKPIWGPA